MKLTERELEQAVLGIEFGSTRIKGILIDEKGTVITGGSFTWENEWKDGIWTYSLDLAVHGLQCVYREIAENVRSEYGFPIRRLAGIGISAMMHGRLLLGENDRQLAPFATWRNQISKQASEILTERFNYHISERYSAALLYQAILDGEPYVREIRKALVLSSYIHYRLTGQNVVGPNEASGMFPVDPATLQYDTGKLEIIRKLVRSCGLPWDIEEILPKVIPAGGCAGRLTKEGAMLLDESGNLESGIPFCPPEGDGGTGLVACNALLPGVGSISAGTSTLLMMTLDQWLRKPYAELDCMLNPAGKPFIMVQSNNGTGEIDRLVRLVSDILQTFGEIYRTLYRKALEGDPASGGVVAFNYYAGEHLTEVKNGHPMLIWEPKSALTLANLMRAELYSVLGVLRIGLNLLYKEEGIKPDRIVAQGGFFKVPGVAQQMVADAFEVPTEVLTTAGEGGAWGIALLAAYMVYRSGQETLPEFLNRVVFASAETDERRPDPEGVRGFKAYFKAYEACFAAEKALDTNSIDTRREE